MWEKRPIYRKSYPSHRQIQDDGVNTEDDTLMCVSIELYIRTEIYLKGDVAVCCSALQCVAVCYSALKNAVEGANYTSNRCVAVCCSVLQRNEGCYCLCALYITSVCCSVLQCVAARRSAVKDVAACLLYVSHQ